MAGDTAVMTLEVKGLAGLQEQLTELGNVTLAVKALASAARKAFKPVLETALALVPQDTGETRLAIRISVKKPAAGESVVVVGLKVLALKTQENVLDVSPARKWHFLEFGTAHMGARPFLRPALDQNAGLVVDLLKVELNKKLNAIRRKAGR